MANWKPIKTASTEAPVLLYNKEWEDEDFNPSGVMDGFYDPDRGWVVAWWNPGPCRYEDRVVEPTHWKLKLSPEQDKILEGII